jgi:hypothetical protein
MRSADEPVLDVDDIRARYTARVAASLPRHTALAARYVNESMPPRWTLEWYLPWWLGSAVNLDIELRRALVVSNVLGLVSVRLEDDLRDGDVPADDVASARALAPTLFEEALAVYRTRLPSSARFWAVLDASMATWRAAADGPDAPKRGAPIKVAAYAACELGGRLDLWLGLDRCLDDTVAALVHYDQFCDWEADLAAGRWNAFVAGVSPPVRRRGMVERNRAAVLTALLTRPVVDEHFALTTGAAARAAEQATELELGPLANYLSGWADQVAAQGAQITRNYSAVADRVTRLMFGNARGGASA